MCSFWSFMTALTSLLFVEILWNGLLRGKGVVILDTGHRLTSHPTDIQIFFKFYTWISVKSWRILNSLHIFIYIKQKLIQIFSSFYLCFLLNILIRVRMIQYFRQNTDEELKGWRKQTTIIQNMSFFIRYKNLFV